MGVTLCCCRLKLSKPIEDETMITVYGFGQLIGVPDASPFVLKIYTYMKMAGIDYQTKAGLHYVNKAPKGKLPFITDDSTTVADSSIIIDYLNSTYAIDLDGHLSDAQKAQSHLYTKSLDEYFYWLTVYSRWVAEDGWSVVKGKFFNAFPIPVRWVAPHVARMMVKSSLKKQGIGRHSETDVLAMAEVTLKHLSSLLGEDEYFFNNTLSSFDAIAFAHLAELIQVDIDGPLNKKAREHKNLVNYCERIRQQFF